MAATSPWPIIQKERQSLADDLSALTEEQWNTQSLCSAWTVRDMLAHMTAAATVTTPTFFAQFVSSGFRFNAFNQQGVDRHRGATPSETLANFTSRIAATTHPPGPSETMLGETMVHSEDIRRPLGIVHQYDAEGVQRATRFFAGSNLIIGGKNRVKGLTLTADDAGWSIGDGPTVRGTALDLLLATTGRTAGLDGLSGDGLNELKSRFS